MPNTVNFQNLELSVEIERSGEFKQLAIELGDHIRSLPLSSSENDDLIKLIINQVMEAERNAFLKGFEMAAKYAGSVTDD